jgi:hypothetical protein
MLGIPMPCGAEHGGGQTFGPLSGKHGDLRLELKLQITNDKSQTKLKSQHPMPEARTGLAMRCSACSPSTHYRLVLPFGISVFDIVCDLSFVI